VPDRGTLKTGWQAALLALVLSLPWRRRLRRMPSTARPTRRRDWAVPLHEAIYHATVRRIKVRAGLRLEQQGDGLYLYRSWVEPRGPLSFIRKEIRDQPVLLDADGAIQPISYRRRDEFSGRHSDMLFDTPSQEVTIDYRGRQVSTRLGAGHL
jgi:hypothetical protein